MSMLASNPSSPDSNASTIITTLGKSNSQFSLKENALFSRPSCHLWQKKDNHTAYSGL